VVVIGLAAALLLVLGVRAWLRPPVPPPIPAVQSGDLVGFRLEVAFPALSFERPVYLCSEPGQPDRLWVIEQGGKVFRFANEAAVSKAELVLDLSAKVSRRGNEEGLLGLAFPPDHATSRVLYLYYSPSAGEGWVGGRSRLSRFRRSAAGAIEPASEEILLELEQPYSNHNGGMLTFGPDGYLYLGLGDGGAAGDIEENGQDKQTLLGSILRLDVSRSEGGKAYAIPADNPFQGDPRARPEIFAFGLRNPWRFSFDREGGALFVGDVGQGTWEEVHEVTRGDNCGWRRHEGFSVYDEDTQAPAASEPVSAYARSEGVSITGGYVYRGPSHAKLRGCYLYGDYLTGNVWALIRDAQAPAVQEGAHLTRAGFRVLKLIEGSPPLASFGEDAAGELYTCHFDGKIRRLVQAEGAQSSGSPSPSAAVSGPR
jgi:glucose/arabinose dehydrogenase